MKLEENYWPDFFSFLNKRIKKPIGHPSYWFYFLVIVTGAGGIGVWKAVFLDKCFQAVASNLMTFFPAVAAASAFEIVLGKDDYKTPKSARVATLFVGLLLIVAVAIIWPNDSTALATVTGTIAALISLVLWWIANAENTALLDSPPGKEAFGGPVSGEVEGDVSEFKF